MAKKKSTRAPKKSTKKSAPAHSIKDIKDDLWDAADELRANSQLKASEYAGPVLGLIFLKHADNRFRRVAAELEKKKTGRRKIGKTDYQARGVLYLPVAARYSGLVEIPEGENIGKAINDAMKAIEEENGNLKGVLPKNYTILSNSNLKTLLKNFNRIPDDIEGDLFGRIYEYFLGKFAMKEGQKGGEFFTPTSVVRLIVEIIEPYHGKIFDPACGSGGMFVQSAEFIQEHRKNPADEISIYGQERVRDTVNLCRMNLAVHGLGGGEGIMQSNAYYEDVHDCVGAFDFVMANPPFNVDKIKKSDLAKDKRFPFGLPKTDNGNYVWISLFYSALNAKGRAGFVMANSASDARHSEQEIRRKIIASGHVDVMITLSSNFFLTVTLPATLWFFDKNKPNTKQKNTVLFIDARNTYIQIDRATRDFAPEQLEFLANIVRLYRGNKLETARGSADLIKANFPGQKYRDVPAVQGRHHRRDRGPGLEPQSGSLRGRRRAAGSGLRLSRTTAGVQRRAGSVE